MASRIRITTRYNSSGEPRMKVTLVAPKASDIKVSRTRKAPPPAKPRPYLAMLRTDLRGYLRVTPEWVPVDDGPPGLIFNVWTSGGSRGATHVDTWFVLKPEEDRAGWVALGSTRTPWSLWVDSEARDFERTCAVEIMRATGIKHPARCI